MTNQALRLSDEIIAKLSRIGEYTIDCVSSMETEITWEAPPALENELSPMELRFRIEADSDEIDINSALSELLLASDQLQPGFAGFVGQFRSLLLHHFEDHAEDDDDDVDFDEDLDGGYIQLTWWSGRVQTVAHFFAEWDPEHGVEFGSSEDGLT